MVNPTVKLLLSELHKLMPEGLRSIGRWETFESPYLEVINDADEKGVAYCYELSNFQKDHVKAVINKYGIGVIMKEQYSDKWRIHSPASFAYWVLSNVAGAAVYGEEVDKRISDTAIALTSIPYK